MELLEVVAGSGRKCLKKCTLTSKKEENAMEDCFCLQDFLQALCFETWDTTSGHIK